MMEKSVGFVLKYLRKMPHIFVVSLKIVCKQRTLIHGLPSRNDHRRVMQLHNHATIYQIGRV